MVAETIMELTEMSKKQMKGQKPTDKIRGDMATLNQLSGIRR